MFYITCSNNPPFDLKDKNRVESIKYILKYLNIETNNENIMKYKQYLSKSALKFINIDNVQRLPYIIDCFELFKTSKKAPHTQIDFTQFDIFDIPLIIEMSIISNNGKQFVVKLCERHFIISNSKKQVFNENIVNSIGISDKHLKFIESINDEYNKSDTLYREIIADAKHLAQTLTKYDPTEHFSTQSKFNRFLDKHRTLIAGSYNTYTIYPIIKTLSIIKFPGIADLMIKMYTMPNRISSTHEDKLASLSIIMRKIKEVIKNHDEMNNQNLIFIESANELLEFIISHKVYEYIKSFDNSSIFDNEIKSEMEDLRTNMNEYMINLFRVYLETETEQRSKGDIIRKIETLNYLKSTFNFTDNSDIFKYVEGIANYLINVMICRMIGRIKLK